MDYEREALAISYDILTADDFKWSDDFDNTMKIDLIKLLLRHFNRPEIEEYEKCAQLKLMLDDLEKMNEDNNKTING